MTILRHLSVCTATFLLLIALTSTTHAVDLNVSVVPDAQPGHHTTISITANQIGFDPGGFDLLLLFDDNRSHFLTARAGTMLTSCDWEYFTYRLFDQDSTSAYQAYSGTHFLQLTGIASATGSHTPICYTQAGEVELAQIDILVAHHSSAADIECQFIPVRFFWLSCNDNFIWNAAGDSAHVALDIGEYGVPGTLNLPFPGSGAPGSDCDTLSTKMVVADIHAVNGGLDVACHDSLYLRGDINLNGIPYEVADAILFSLYFQYGIGVLPGPLPASIANSDVNADGLPLSVADYVYLLRVIFYQLLPVPN